MKRLYVLRHSKAGQTNKRILDDDERPLTDKGKDLCSHIGRYMSAEQYLPDLVVSLTSTRTKETIELVTEQFAKTVPVEYSSKLYLASPRDIFSEIRAFGDDHNAIMIVGHNPGLQQFAIALSGSGDKKLFREMRSSFPTGGLAIFDLPKCDSWKDINTQSGELIGFATKENYTSTVSTAA